MSSETAAPSSDRASRRSYCFMGRSAAPDSETAALASDRVSVSYEMYVYIYIYIDTYIIHTLYTCYTINLYTIAFKTDIAPANASYPSRRRVYLRDGNAAPSLIDSNSIDDNSSNI